MKNEKKNLISISTHRNVIKRQKLISSSKSYSPHGHVCQHSTNPGLDINSWPTRISSLPLRVFILFIQLLEFSGIIGLGPVTSVNDWCPTRRSSAQFPVQYELTRFRLFVFVFLCVCVRCFQWSRFRNCCPRTHSLIHSARKKKDFKWITKDITIKW